MNENANNDFKCLSARRPLMDTNEIKVRHDTKMESKKEIKGTNTDRLD